MSPPQWNAPLLVAIALILAQHQQGVAFSARSFHGGRPRGRAARRGGTRMSGSNAENAESIDSRTSSMTTLTFFGEATVASDPAPAATKDGKKSLSDFFALPEPALLLLRGSKNNRVREVRSVDAGVSKRYERMCDRVGASPPSSDDRIFDVTTTGVQFPGLQVISRTTIGAKLTNARDLPGYEFVLIRDSTYAEGNRLFVWFFNKVTGKDRSGYSKGSSSSDDQTTFSLNTISVHPTKDGKVSFKSNANLCVRIRFPSFLMKAIPGASREKFERTGGESLRKVLEGDLPASLELFRQEYVRWLES